MRPNGMETEINEPIARPIRRLGFPPLSPATGQRGQRAPSGAAAAAPRSAADRRLAPSHLSCCSAASKIIIISP